MGESEKLLEELEKTEVVEFCRKDHDVYKRLIGQIDKGFKKASDAYVAIACSLWQIYHNEYFRIDNYKSVVDFALDRYEIKKSTTHNYIKVIEKFGEIADGKVSSLKEQYKPFSCSQLINMLTFTPEQLEQVKPDWSVREIIDFGKRPLLMVQDEEEDEEEIYLESSDSILASDYMTAPEIETGRTLLAEFSSLDDVVKNREVFENAYRDMCSDANFKNRNVRFVLELVFD